MTQNAIVGSENVIVLYATKDNEPATALAADLLTKNVGYDRCVVHTIALSINDFFFEGRSWNKYMAHVNKVTSYFNQNPKAAQLILKKKCDDGVTDDRVQGIKNKMQTRWNSR